MQGTIAQVVALVVHGNSFLSSSDPAAAFPSNHSALGFCEFVRFVDLNESASGWVESPFSPDPRSWLRRLRKEGVNAIRMAYLPTGGTGGRTTDRMHAGFVGGGGRWVLEAKKPNGSDYWEGRWEIGDSDRADQKIWRVTYGRIASNQPSAPPDSIDLEDLRRKLAENLTEISAFARRQNLDGFANAFETGLSNLQSGSPGRDLYHADLLSLQLSLAAAQLLSAAQSAWVFGGMGSWNDLGFNGEDQSVYERLSEELYQLLNASIVASANSTAQPAPNTQKRTWWRLWT